MRAPLARPRPTAAATPARATAQAWVRHQVADVTGGLLHRGDGSLVAVVQIEPANLALLSDRERAQRVASLHEALQGVRDAYQILVLPRPIDLDAYLRHLEELLHDTDPRRRRLLAQYLAYVRSLVGSGQALERRFYLLLPLGPAEARRKGAAADLTQRAREIVAALERASLHARVLDDGGIQELAHTFLHPAQAAFLRSELPSPATIYVPEEAAADGPVA